MTTKANWFRNCSMERLLRLLIKEKIGIRFAYFGMLMKDGSLNKATLIEETQYKTIQQTDFSCTQNLIDFVHLNKEEIIPVPLVVI